jgi:hypothetical protein
MNATKKQNFFLSGASSPPFSGACLPRRNTSRLSASVELHVVVGDRPKRVIVGNWVGGFQRDRAPERRTLVEITRVCGHDI